ncbi:hypothetical protein MEQU1_002767 [Malassezia equina]|uniref:Transmembrane protein 115 n=1 Tax=Malassezia equina TaxID=1381935 RepID=A0AAF0J4I9_9BASI|nr:hypothetical protein MEQU1_002767 [Malassezia equina]
MARSGTQAVRERVHDVCAQAMATPPGTRVLLALLCVCTAALAAVCVLFSVRAENAPYLVLVVGLSWRFPWVLFTSAFASSTWLEFFLYAVSVTAAAPFLEAQWGMQELWLFSVAVIASSNVVTWFLGLMLGLLFRNEQILFATHWDGLHTLLTGFLVAYAQLVPEATLPYLSRLRARDVPMLVVTIANVPCFFGILPRFLPIQIAWITSWIYLRFYQAHPEGPRGDSSDAFAFVLWFPPPAQPVLAPVFNTLHRLAYAARLVPRNAGYMDLELSLAQAQRSGAREEAERRRAMALAALDARVAPAAASPAPA